MSSTSEGYRVEPASMFDFNEAISDTGRSRVLSRRYLALYARQVSEGAALTFRTQSGGLCLIAGLWPENGYAEAWFAVGSELRSHMLPVLRLAEGVLQFVMADAGLDEARCFIHPDSVAGARLAALFKFKLTDAEAGVYVRRFGCGHS